MGVVVRITTELGFKPSNGQLFFSEKLDKSDPLEQISFAMHNCGFPPNKLSVSPELRIVIDEDGSVIDLNGL